MTLRNSPNLLLYNGIDISFSFVPLTSHVLSNYNSQALVGILLGDGHIQKRSIKGNSRLMFTQSIKHEEYFYLVFNLFKDCCSNHYKPTIKSIVSNQTSNKYKFLTFVTLSLPCFNYYRDIYYPNGIKQVPLNIEDIFTEISLAYWIMDDGSKQGKGIHLNTYGFNIECVERLIEVLTKKFNLKCTIHLKNNKPRIFISADSMNVLKIHVLNHIHPKMLYKLGL